MSWLNMLLRAVVQLDAARCRVLEILRSFCRVSWVSWVTCVAFRIFRHFASQSIQSILEDVSHGWLPLPGCGFRSCDDVPILHLECAGLTRLDPMTRACFEHSLVYKFWPCPSRVSSLFLLLTFSTHLYAANLNELFWSVACRGRKNQSKR